MKRTKKDMPSAVFTKDISLLLLLEEYSYVYLIKCYSNIIAFTDKQEYPTKFDKITVTIKNENPGKGFYFFSIPVIEYNDKGEWKLLNYSPESYEIPEQWALCAILDDTERQFCTAQSIFNDRLKGSWNPGEYRAVVFVGKETVYAPFTIIDN